MIRWMPAVMLVCESLVCIAPSEASVVEYTNNLAWQSAINNDYLTIDFTGFPSATFITNQYSGVGATFTDGNDFITNSPSLYLNDGSGLNGNSFTNPDIISISFAASQHWIGAVYPGTLAYKLYQNDVLVFASSFEHGDGITGQESFYGLVSSDSFNKAVLFRYTGIGVNIDDLYYNAAPVPGGLAVMCGLVLISRRRRR